MFLAKMAKSLFPLSLLLRNSEQYAKSPRIPRGSPPRRSPEQAPNRVRISEQHGSAVDVEGSVVIHSKLCECSEKILRASKSRACEP
jgi:hypothetical protein